MKRAFRYLLDLSINGMIFFGSFCLILIFLVPHTLFFDYGSVEHVGIDEFHDGDFISMASNINYNKSTDPFTWKDELRCNYQFDKDGFYDYVGVYPTESLSPKIIKEPYIAPWKYRGEMPEYPGVCIMISEVTKLVYGFVPVKQTLVSEPFNVW